MESIWKQTCSLPEREALTGDIETDVCVIGAGMAGLLTAYFLQEKGLKTVVIESDKVAGGVTQNTTAKITSQHGMIYNKLIQNFGEEKHADMPGQTSLQSKNTGTSSRRTP